MVLSAHINRGSQTLEVWLDWLHISASLLTHVGSATHIHMHLLASLAPASYPNLEQQEQQQKKKGQVCLLPPLSPDSPPSRPPGFTSYLAVMPAIALIIRGNNATTTTNTIHTNRNQLPDPSPGYPLPLYHNRKRPRSSTAAAATKSAVQFHQPIGFVCCQCRYRSSGSRCSNPDRPDCPHRGVPRCGNCPILFTPPRLMRAWGG
ncbi:Uu.00g108760.m01.CDS01 [Anthostomella pinea]|uniref:Uu.00g108760.m01.CDS01 n=1 Tax=Anthostomella pinea TaxID=933095 RepID=A0AAI8VEI8_9PEZI|nr:Uu.00g108760.m01.CDS01 [Anthostomella pinea]